MTPEERLELLLDLVAEELIESTHVDSNDVADAQKFILNGQLQQGGGVGVLALFQKDIEANEADLQQTIIINEGQEDEQTIPSIQNIANNVDFDTLEITVGQGPIINLKDGGEYTHNPEITEYLFGENNPLNVSQFISLGKEQSLVDVERANEYLDTNIFELLPTGDTRQARIIRFFQELNALLPPTIETEQWDEDSDGNVDRLIDGTWSGAEQYSQDNSISYAQDNPDESNIGEEDAFIHRLKDTANDTNSSRTIQDIYNTVRPYLRDILEDTPGLEGLPEYENQSSGYLKFRNLNQGIIVRNTNQEFVQGLDPSNPTYLDTGFTITMWVRFLDKVSEGTLFNFGNPMRGYGSDPSAFGFKLETYVLNKEDGNFTTSNNYDNYGEAAQYIIDRDDNYIPPFENANTARFVRLVVNDNGVLRDSHTATGAGTKMNTIWDESTNGDTESKRFRRLQTTFIPENFNEWYFICATFNHINDEDGSFDLSDPSGTNLNYSTDFWLNHIDPTTGNYVANSGLGNRCKVEIISRSDLLRARGFNT